MTPRGRRPRRLALALLVRGLLPTADTYFGLRLLVMWVLFAPTWFAAVLVYLVADRERKAVTRFAVACAIGIAENCIFLAGMYFNW